VWRLYMAGSARAFAIGRIGIIQALFSKIGEDGLSNLPLTRKDLYRPGPGSERCLSSPAPALTGHC
jgi:cyclopropane-fatty-acyl-phospholipid synthase